MMTTSNRHEAAGAASQTVLITGASAGIGKSTAERLLREGYTVYAAARRVENMRGLEDLGAVALKMDVTREEDLVAAVERITAEHGGVDVLVNNAGFGLFGAMEDISLDDARYQFEVNLFGLAHLTQLVLPHMRAEGSGRIVNVSSVGGRIWLPLAAWYDATKHALEGWSDCLRYETAPFGIQVVIIQPGAIKTEFGDVTNVGLDKYAVGTAYRDLVGRYIELRDTSRTMARATDASVLAKVYLKAATTRRPRRRYVKGAFARPVLFVRKWFGDGVYEFALRGIVR